MQRLGLDPEKPQERRLTHVWGGVHETPILIMPRLRVFGQERCDIEVACGDLPPAIKLDLTAYWDSTFYNISIYG